MSEFEPILINERARDIGGFSVGRLIPVAKKRMVGPFAFVDHMGPSTIGPGNYMRVDQHPHIGLSTLTYLFEGSILHKDSIGSEQLITPGAVNWMSAGRGVTHTEETPSEQKDGAQHSIHGYQIWVALPLEKEDMEPAFQHVPAEELPRENRNGVELCLIAGEAFGRKSPVAVHSPLYLLALHAAGDASLAVAEHIYGEAGLIVVNGRVRAGAHALGAAQMLLIPAADLHSIELEAGSRVLLLGGEALPEPRFIDWNFVASSREKIETAKTRWRERGFDRVPGDESYVPLPD